MDDPRFDYNPLGSWRKNGKAAVLNNEYVEVEKYANMAINPSELQFSLGGKMPALFSDVSRFKVTGLFEMKDTALTAWKPIPAAEYDKVAVSPNWFEKLIRNEDLFHENYQVKVHDEPMYSSGYLNQYLYHAMDEKLKKFLCPEPCHTGNGVPTDSQKWTCTAESEWHKYSKTIFTGAPVTFTWIPLFSFPFFQGSNHVLDSEQCPKCVPVNHMGRLVYRIRFIDDFGYIFNKKDEENNPKKYRFRLTHMNLMVEQVRMNPSVEARLFKNSKAQLNYHGVTKVARVENISTATMTYKLQFNNVVFPESMFIFALDKTVVGGSYQFANETSSIGPFFMQHNIKKVTLGFSGESFSPEEPQIGNVTDEYMDFKFWLDDTRKGPFGVKLSARVLNLRNVKTGYTNTDFPHLHFNLTTDKNRSRLVPQLCDANIYNKPGDLSVSLTFADGGSAKDASYFVYLAYTDTNVIFDLKTKKFSSYYGLK